MNYNDLSVAICPVSPSAFFSANKFVTSLPWRVRYDMIPKADRFELSGGEPKDLDR